MGVARLIAGSAVDPSSGSPPTRSATDKTLPAAVRVWLSPSALRLKIADTTAAMERLNTTEWADVLRRA